jgi:homoaconitase/3-isopropylmalate dehydratase large subunit
MSMGATRVHRPQQPVFTLDHDVQNTSPQYLEKCRLIEAFAKQHGIDLVRSQLATRPLIHSLANLHSTVCVAILYSPYYVLSCHLEQLWKAKPLI